MERNRSANPRFRESRDSAPVVEQFANNIGPRRLNFSSHQTLPFPENSDHGDFRSQRSSLKRNPLQSDPWNQEAQTGFSNQQDHKQYSPANSLFRSRSTANTRLPDSISNNRLQDSNQSWSIALPAKQVVNKSIPTDFTDPNLFPESSSQQMQHLAKRERLKEALKQVFLPF